MIPVGDSGEVELIFHAKARQRGILRKSAAVTVNDNSRDKFNLMLNGEMFQHDESDSLKPLALSEAMFSFDPNEKDEWKEIEVTNVSDSDLQLTMIADGPQFFEVKLPDKVKAGKTEKIKVKVLKDSPKPYFDKSFTFEMNDPDTTRLTLPVSLTREIPMTKPNPSPKAAHAKGTKVMPDTAKTGGNKSEHAVDNKGGH